MFISSLVSSGTVNNNHVSYDTKASFGSRGATIVDDGSHNSTLFGSMHACG